LYIAFSIFVDATMVKCFFSTSLTFCYCQKGAIVLICTCYLINKCIKNYIEQNKVMLNEVKVKRVIKFGRFVRTLEDQWKC
jgi:hypothetical protein